MPRKCLFQFAYQDTFVIDGASEEVGAVRGKPHNFVTDTIPCVVLGSTWLFKPMLRIAHETGVVDLKEYRSILKHKQSESHQIVRH